MNNNDIFYQNVVVMRHGDRIDNFEPLWVSTATRPWDPPLIDDGLIRAFRTGRKLRSQVKLPIHRVFVSPFIRCIQTASQVIAALCAIDDDANAMSSTDVLAIDPSKLKVSIEFGLCEMLNSEAIRLDFAPKNGDFCFNISELEAMLPAGLVDHTVEPVYKELPKWEETVMDARARYANVIKKLADKYPTDNLLLVTHEFIHHCDLIPSIWKESAGQITYGNSRIEQILVETTEASPTDRELKDSVSFYNRAKCPLNYSLAIQQ